MGFFVSCWEQLGPAAAEPAGFPGSWMWGWAAWLWGWGREQPVWCWRKLSFWEDLEGSSTKWWHFWVASQCSIVPFTLFFPLQSEQCSAHLWDQCSQGHSWWSACNPGLDVYCARSASASMNIAWPQVVARDLSHSSALLSLNTPNCFRSLGPAVQTQKDFMSVSGQTYNSVP